MILPQATIAITKAPQIAPGALELVVDCPASTTQIVVSPGALSLTREQIILFAGYQHEERCQQCDVSSVLAQGDQLIRELTETAWAGLLPCPN